MGGANNRIRREGIDDYGATYGPYDYPYGELENYGSVYQPIEEDGPFPTPVDPTLVVPTPPRRVRARSNNLGQYGTSYPPGFNPMVSSLLTKPRVRVVYMPVGIYNGLQNLFQQGAFAGLNSVLPPNLGVFAPGQSGPQLFPGPSGLLPNLSGNGPALFSQTPYGNPFMQQAPISPMGPNCFSVSLQIPSAPSPYPIPCPPPMIQPIVIPMGPQFPPIMPQVPMPPPPPPPMVYPPFIPSVPCPSPVPFGPQPPPVPNIPQQPFYPPYGVPFNNGLSAYAGFPQYPGYGGPNALPSVSGFPYMNTGVFGPQGMGAYGGGSPYPYSGGCVPSGFYPTGQPMYQGFNPGMQNPLAPFPYNNFPGGGGGYVPQQYYGGGYGAPYGNLFNPGQNAYPNQSPYASYGQPGYPCFNPISPCPSGFSQSGLNSYSGQPYYPGYPPGFVGGQGQNFYPPQFLPSTNYGGLGGYGGPGYYPGCAPCYPAGFPGAQGQGPYGPSGLGFYGSPGPMSVAGQPYMPGFNQSVYPPYYCPPGMAPSQGQYPSGQPAFPGNYSYPGYGNTFAQPYYANQYPNNVYPGGVGGGQQGPYAGFYPPGYLGFNPINQYPSGFAPNYQPGNAGYSPYNPYYQQPIPNLNYPGYQGIPSIPQQPSGFSGFSPQPYYNYPGVNANNPYAYAPMPGFSSPGNNVFRPFPGRTGRVTLVCCAIPE